MSASQQRLINPDAQSGAKPKTPRTIPDYDPATDPYAPMKALITRTEGTTKLGKDGKPINPYNTTLDYGRWLKDGKEVDLEKMTLTQLKGLAEEMWAKQRAAGVSEKALSSAMGKYQMTVTHMLAHAKQMGLDPNTTVFDAKTQEAIQNHWLAATGLRPGNEKNFNKVWDAISGQWESVGNSASVRTIGSSKNPADKRHFVDAKQHEKEREAIQKTFDRLNDPSLNPAAKNSTSNTADQKAEANRPPTPSNNDAKPNVAGDHPGTAKSLVESVHPKQSAIRDAENEEAKMADKPVQPKPAPATTQDNEVQISP